MSTDNGYKLIQTAQNPLLLTKRERANCIINIENDASNMTVTFYY